MEFCVFIVISCSIDFVFILVLEFSIAFVSILFIDIFSSFSPEEDRSLMLDTFVTLACFTAASGLRELTFCLMESERDCCANSGTETLEPPVLDDETVDEKNGEIEHVGFFKSAAKRSKAAKTNGCAFRNRSRALASVCLEAN